MAQALELPRPMMCRRARLDTDQARLKRPQYRQQLIPSNLAAQHWLPSLVNAVKLENVLAMSRPMVVTCMWTAPFPDGC
jgi:hypothetical protein